MNNFKWAIVGDCHFGVRNDNKIFHTIMIDFFKKLVSDMKAESVSTLILLGDIFERRKFINFETLMICKREVFDLFLENNIKVVMIAGNHDVYFKNTNRINSLELLLPLQEYPNITSVVHEATEVIIDDIKVLFVPWINKENYESAYKTINDTDALYMVAHLDMAGFEMHRGAVSEHGHFDKEFLAKFDKVITGHYHTKSNKGNIYYLGTPYATSWNDYGEDKGYHFFENGEFRFIKNEFETFYRFVYDDRNDVAGLAKSVKSTDLKDKYIKVIVKSKKKPRVFEAFINLIETQAPADLNILDETNFVREVQDGETSDAFTDTLSVIQNYINVDMETDLSKDKLFANMAMLYNDALEMTDGD